MLGRMLVWFLALVILLFVAIWTGDIFTRVVDTRSVRIARWVEERCLRRA